MKQDIKLSHIDSIMLILDKLSKKKKNAVCYEDIVVAMYKEYPEQFHLKGYPQYPDSEPIGKRISDAKKRGLVRLNDKMVNITDLGEHFIEDLKNKLQGKSIRSAQKLSRISEKELKRIQGLQGFLFYCKNEEEKILDTDFYAYFSVSVRTEKNSFLSQVNLLEKVIKETASITSGPKSDMYKKVIDYHYFLVKKFQDYLDFKKNS